MALLHLKGKFTLLEKMKLTLFKKEVVHFTEFVLCACSMYSCSEFELKKNNTIFTVSEIQTIDNGLPQPHFQGFFSPQQIAYFKNDPTLDTFIAFLSLHRSINTAYEKNIKCKKPRRQCFFRTFFYNIYLVWIQKLKQPMITIKVMTEN